jgi:hypothetical protein
MKKISLLIGLLVIVFAATAYAQPVEFKMSGFMDFVAATFKNIPGSSGGFSSYANGAGTEIDPAGGNVDHSGAIADSRARLKFQANAGKELSATIFFEMDSATWGDANGTRNSMGYWNADRAGVEIKHAFFDVAVPYFGVPVPTTVRLGIQPLSIRDTWFLYVDGAGIVAQMKPDPLNIKLAWMKPYEGNVYNSDDADVFAADVSGTIEGFTLGAHGSYWNINSYPLPTSVPAVGTPANGSADMYWLGAYADGKYAGFEFNFDFIYDGGKVKPKGADDIKLSGWMAALGVDFPWEIWDFGGGLWYATGANTDDTNKQKAYLVPPGSEPGPDAFTKYSSIFFGSGLFRGEYGYAANSDHSNASGQSIGGTWGINLYAGLKLTPWYKVYLDGMYLGDTTKNGDTVGNSGKDENAIGYEFTLSNIFKVYNNLDLYVIGGYLIAGDALDMVDGTGKIQGNDNPWALATRLVYSF